MAETSGGEVDEGGDLGLTGAASMALGRDGRRGYLRCPRSCRQHIWDALMARLLAQHSR